MKDFEVGEKEVPEEAGAPEEAEAPEEAMVEDMVDVGMGSHDLDAVAEVTDAVDDLGDT
jgi:hypothetical protein